MSKVVVVGAGQAAASLVSKLRAEGFDGEILVIGAERALPYQRPPLSKAYLLGDMEEARLYLRPESWYADNRIDLRLGVEVTDIDTKAKDLTLSDGDQVHYDQLVLTTGSVPRTLPAKIGGTLENVLTVRDLGDVDRMKPLFDAGGHVLVIGGGYIGLEAAAVAAKKGLEVTLVEMADRILQRVAAPETSDYFRALHRSHGVKILEGVGLSHLTGEGSVTGAVLSDGTELAIDFAIVGVGILPATDLAEVAGVTLDNGIAVDARGQTSDPAIWAAGDCASFPHKGGRIRLESVGNAIDQAEVIAANIAGTPTEYHAKPWFWSDQYDTKLQIAGLNTGYDRIVVREGEGSRSHWYYKGDDLLAVDSMNDGRSYLIGKRLIEAGKSPAPDAIADPGTDLKALLKA